MLWVGGNFSPNQIKEKLFWLLVFWIWGLRNQETEWRTKAYWGKILVGLQWMGPRVGPQAQPWSDPRLFYLGNFGTFTRLWRYGHHSDQGLMGLWGILPLGSQVSILFLQKSRFDVNTFLINQRFYTWSSPFILN